MELRPVGQQDAEQQGVDSQVSRIQMRLPGEGHDMTCSPKASQKQSYRNENEYRREKTKRIGLSGRTPSNHQIHQQRQKNVKVLLYGERPKVAIGPRKVALEEKDVMLKWRKNGDWAMTDEANEHGE